jgi:hypothetical protein
VNACVHTYTKPRTSSTRSRGLGRRIHESVENTKLSTNKQHSLSKWRLNDYTAPSPPLPSGTVYLSSSSETLILALKHPLYTTR